MALKLVNGKYKGGTKKDKEKLKKQASAKLSSSSKKSSSKSSYKGDYSGSSYETGDPDMGYIASNSYQDYLNKSGGKPMPEKEFQCGKNRPIWLWRTSCRLRGRCQIQRRQWWIWNKSIYWDICWRRRWRRKSNCRSWSNRTSDYYIHP